MSAEGITPVWMPTDEDICRQWTRASQHSQDYLQHALGPGQNIVVPEPDHLPTFIFEPSRPPGIVRAAGMLAAVEFNDHASLDAGKISDKRAEWMLAAEFVTVQLPIADQRPKTLLGIGHIGAQFSDKGIGHA